MKRSYKIIASVVCLVAAPAVSFSQGLINNGAFIEVTAGAFIYVDGGLATGNFTNQNSGAFTGTVESLGTIDVTGDWINNSSANVFNANTGLVRLLGNNDQYIQGTATTYFNNLTLGGSGIKYLNVNTLAGGGFASPAGILDLASLPLYLNGFRLTMNNPSSAAIIRTTGIIRSETNAATNPSIIQWNMGTTNGTYVYPFGVTIAASDYIPLTISKMSGSANISASTRMTALSNNQPWAASVTHMYSPVIGGAGEIPVVIDRWWDITPTTPVNASVIFSYRGIENTTTYGPTGTFAAQNWDGSWLPPVGSGAGVTSGISTVAIPAQNLFYSPWVLSNLSAPLPIELISFTAVLNDQVVDVAWTTASEINSDYFTIEKTIDGINFEFVEQRTAAGNSNVTLEYFSKDTKPYAGISYYRLTETDLDGTTQRSHLVPVINIDENVFEVLSLTQNENGLTSIIFYTSLAENILFSLNNIHGQKIFANRISAIKGVNKYEFNASDFSEAIYLASFSNGEKSITKKFFSPVR